MPVVHAMHAIVGSRHRRGRMVRWFWGRVVGLHGRVGTRKVVVAEPGSMFCRVSRVRRVARFGCQGRTPVCSMQVATSWGLGDIKTEGNVASPSLTVIHLLGEAAFPSPIFLQGAIYLTQWCTTLSTLPIAPQHARNRVCYSLSVSNGRPDPSSRLGGRKVFLLFQLSLAGPRMSASVPGSACAVVVTTADVEVEVGFC